MSILGWGRIRSNLFFLYYFSAYLCLNNLLINAVKINSKREMQMLRVESHYIQLSFVLKYVSNSIAALLTNSNESNEISEKFCDAVNDAAGQSGSIEAMKDGITLFTRSATSYEPKSCKISGSVYHSKKDEKGMLEISVVQRVYVSTSDFEVNQSEVEDYVKLGMKRSDLFVKLLQNLIDSIETVEIMDEFSSPIASTSSPSFSTNSNYERFFTNSSLLTNLSETSPNFVSYTNKPPRLSEKNNSVSISKSNKSITIVNINNSNFEVVSPSNNSVPMSNTEARNSSNPIPVAYIAAIAASTSAVVVLVLFLLYFFTRRNSIRRAKKNEEEEKKPIAPAPAPPVRKVPSFIDIEEMKSIDESTIGDHTAGRKPLEKKVVPPPPAHKPPKPTSKPLALNIDYEEDTMYPNRVITPGTASPSLSANSKVSTKAPSRTMVSGQSNSSSSQKDMISPVSYYSSDDQAYNSEYHHPDPEPVVLSSESESDNERVNRKEKVVNRFPRKEFQPVQSFPQKNLEIKSTLDNAKTKQKPIINMDDGSDENSKEGNNPWLFDTVTDTLGPRGISADMESLGERSRQSHKSHRSRHHWKKGGSSVGSKGSKGSNSLRSHRSQVSKTPSEASRSVAMDLLRLESQLSSLGKTESNTAASVHSFNSKSTAASKRRQTRNFLKITAPAGKLGVILANRQEKPGTLISEVRPTSPLNGKVFPGDRIVSIDGENVSMMPVSEITSIMARKSEFERVLTVLTSPKRITKQYVQS